MAWYSILWVQFLNEIANIQPPSTKLMGFKSSAHTSANFLFKESIWTDVNPIFFRSKLKVGCFNPEAPGLVGLVNSTLGCFVIRWVRMLAVVAPKEYRMGKR